MSKKDVEKIQEREADYRRIGAEKLARTIAAKFPGGRAVVIRPTDFGYEMDGVTDIIAGLKAGFGADVEITDVIAPKIPAEYEQQMEEMKKQYLAETGESELPPDFMMMDQMMNMVDAASFTEVTKRIPDGTDIVVLLVDFPYDMEKMALWSMKPMPAVGAVVNMAQPQMKLAIQQEFIDAIVLPKPMGDFKSMDVPKDLDEAFERRFILVTPENVEAIVGQYGNMFPDK
jgi:hypothetical protein